MGQREGQGFSVNNQGIKYIGEFKNNMRHGDGKEVSIYGLEEKLIRIGIWE